MLFSHESQVLNYWRDTQTEVATIDSINSQGDELHGLSSLVTGPNPSAIAYKRRLPKE